MGFLTIGFAIGSLISGVLYNNVGGVSTLRYFTFLAACTSVLYFIFYVTYLKYTIPKTGTDFSRIINIIFFIYTEKGEKYFHFN